MHLNLNFLWFLVGPLRGACVRQAPKFTGDFGGKPCNARPVIDVGYEFFTPHGEASRCGHNLCWYPVIPPKKKHLNKVLMLPCCGRNMIFLWLFVGEKDPAAFFRKRVNFEKDAKLNLAHAVGLHDFSRLIEVN